MKFTLLLCLATAGLTPLVITRPASALQEKGSTPLKMRYVKPSLMAWWLDKAHHPLPEGVTPAEAAIRPKLTENPQAKGLPFGVDRIEPNDAENILTVYGTPEGMTIVRVIAEILDRPFDSTQFEEQRVQVATASVVGLGITFAEDKPNPQAPLRVGQVNGTKVRSSLMSLIGQNKAKVLSMPKPTTIEELAGSLQKTEPQNATIGIMGEDGTFHPFFVPPVPGQVDPTPVKVQTSEKLSITPTINPDSTLSLAVNLEQTIKAASQGPLTAALAAAAPQPLKANIKTQEGDVVAFVIPGDAKASPPNSIVIFLTPRIVRPVAAIPQ
ncbi:hypothetical protein EON83_08315 [bacterium]|nr:MAG: hypothetical protein EON83_08315 [bacterium]